MNNCCACFNSQEVDEELEAERNRMLYLNNISRSPKVTTRVEQSTILARGLSQHQLPTHGQSPLQYHQAERRVFVEKIRSRNILMRSQVQDHRWQLLDRIGHLQRRSDQLRAHYISTDSHLQGLVGEINRNFR